MQLFLNSMFLIIATLLLGAVHGGTPCKVNDVDGYRYGSSPCVAFRVNPKNLLIQATSGIHTLGEHEPVEMDVDGQKKKWIIEQITAGGANFKHDNEVKFLDAAAISKGLGKAGNMARISAYNRFDYYSAHDDDYGAYDDQALYDEAWENLQAAREQFEVAQRLVHRAQRQGAQKMKGQAAGQRLMRYGAIKE